MTTPTATCSHTDALRTFAALVREMRTATTDEAMGAEPEIAAAARLAVDVALDNLPDAPGWCEVCKARAERDEARRTVAELSKLNGELMNERDGLLVALKKLDAMAVKALQERDKARAEIETLNDSREFLMVRLNEARGLVEFAYRDGWRNGNASYVPGEAACGADWDNSEAKKRLEGGG